MNAVANLRSDARRTQPSWYPRRYTVKTRYADIDDQRHINNVALLTLSHEARLQWLREVMAAASVHEFLEAAGSLRTRRVITEFLTIGEYPTPVEAGLRFEQCGPYGLRMALGLFQNGVCIALQDCELGWYAQGDWAGLPPLLLNVLQAGDAVSGYRFEARSQAWLEPERYPVIAPMQTRYGDKDALGYIGEDMACRLFEAARTERLLPVAVQMNFQMRTVIGRLVYESHAIRRVHGEISSASCISQVGRSSATWQMGLFHGRKCLASLEAVQINVDENTRPQALPDSLRELLVSWGPEL